MVRKKSKKRIEWEKIQEWKRKIFERDNGMCQICVSQGKLNKLGKHYQTHHLLPRQLKDYKFDILNGILLCFNHHKLGVYSAHNNGLWFYEWLKHYKPEHYLYCSKIIKNLKFL